MDPETPHQWQEAVDIAQGFLVLESARLFGLVKGGPKVNVDRCEYILAEGRKRGYLPATDAAEKVAIALAGG